MFQVKVLDLELGNFVTYNFATLDGVRSWIRGQYGPQNYLTSSNFQDLCETFERNILHLEGSEAVGFQIPHLEGLEMFISEGEFEPNAVDPNPEFFVQPWRLVIVHRNLEEPFYCRTASSLRELEDFFEEHGIDYEPLAQGAVKEIIFTDDECSLYFYKGLTDSVLAYRGGDFREEDYRLCVHELEGK